MVHLIEGFIISMVVELLCTCMGVIAKVGCYRARSRLKVAFISINQEVIVIAMSYEVITMTSP
jgi:hypothetical protein